MFRQLKQTAFNVVRRCLFDSSHVPRPKDRFNRHLKVKDYGYAWNYYVPGEPLPRMKGCMTPVITENRKRKLEDENEEGGSWSKENALMGQNDYIDILGDGSVHPAQLLYHVPGWLKGFPGYHRANELIRLIHYRNLYNNKLKRNSPRRWHELMKRIHYLLKYHNYRKQDEIRLERKLGLWNEEPDYYYKDKEKRTYKDLP